MIQKMTAEEAAESLTGFDEIAIKRAFGSPVASISNEDPMTLLRALVFVVKRREGMNDTDAKNACLELTVKEVSDYFEANDEPNPEDPVTESGKDS